MRRSNAPHLPDCTLLIIHETDGRWAIHGLGAPGVRLTNDVMATLAESILKKARR